MNAFIHPDARIGQDCQIGPGVVIDQHVEIGDRCQIQAHAVVTGHTTIGSDNKIGYGAVIGAEPQDTAFQSGIVSHVRIGSRNTIREHVTIHRGTRPGTSTTLGDDNYLMAGVHLAHNCAVGNHVTLVNNTLLAGYVEVADRAFLGGAVVVHQFVRIGPLVMVRGLTRLGLDLPPYFMAVDTNTVAGINRVGLRRAGMTPDTLRTIFKVYQRLYHAGLNRLQAVAAIRQDPKLQTPEAAIICDFIDKTKRGIARPARSGRPWSNTDSSEP